MTVPVIRAVFGVSVLLAVASADAQYAFPGPPPGHYQPPAFDYQSPWAAAYESESSLGLMEYLPSSQVGGPPSQYLGGISQANYTTPGGQTATYGGGPVYAGGTPIAGGGSLASGPSGVMVSGPTAYPGGMMMDPMAGGMNGMDRQWMEPWNDNPADCPPGSIGYQQSLGQAGSIGVFGSQGTNHPAGGARWQLGQAGILRGVEAGVYANDDQTVLSGGATVGLYDVGHFFVGTRVLGNAVLYPEGPTTSGVSVDLFASKRVEIWGWEHYLKFGWFYDGQSRIRRHGPEIAGILFTNDKLPDLTFDIAVGIGDGQGFVQDRYVQAAEVETQLRGGIQFTEWLNLGVRGTFAKFEDPFYQDVGDFGGYGSIDLGNVLVNIDVAGGNTNARGFINVVWQPDYGYPARHPRVPATITQTGHDQKYAGWMSRPVLRDISMRTGTPVNQGPDVTPVGNLTQVYVATRFPSIRALPDANTNGFADPGEGFEVDFILRNLTLQDSNGIQVLNASVSGPANVAFLGSSPLTVVSGNTIRTNATEGAVINILNTAQAGEQIVLTFNVLADGETRSFSAQFTVGQVRDGLTQLTTPL